MCSHCLYLMTNMSLAPNPNRLKTQFSVIFENIVLELDRLEFKPTFTYKTLGKLLNLTNVSKIWVMILFIS